MEYNIANFTLRTEGRHNDIAACGLRSFKVFEVEPQTNKEADMVLRLDSTLDKDNYPITKMLLEFDFENLYATCSLARYATGYRYTLYRNNKTYLFIKEDGSNLVESNIGCEERVDVALLRFGIWIMFGIVIAPLGGIAIHSSVNVKDGKALLCLGESGTGKSTHTRLWRENIEGSWLLNDDSPIIRMVDGKAVAFGSPWSGKTPCYINDSAPIVGFLRLSQAPFNKIHRLSPLSAIGALLPSCPPAFAHDDTLQDYICDTLSNMIACTPAYHLECLPNAEAAQLSYSTIYGR